MGQINTGDHNFNKVLCTGSLLYKNFVISYNTSNFNTISQFLLNQGSIYVRGFDCMIALLVSFPSIIYSSCYIHFPLSFLPLVA